MAKRKKSVTNKITEAEQPTSWHPLQVQREKAEIVFIKKFLGLVPVVKKNRRGKLVGKKFSRQEITSLYNELARLIIEKRIIKISPYKSQVEMIQEKLSTLLQKMGSQIEFGITPQTHQILSRITPLEIVRPSIRLLKEYASLHGQAVTTIKEKMFLLRKEFTTGVRNGSINKDDPFCNDIKTSIVPSLTYYLEGAGRKKKIFQAKNLALHGFEELSFAKEKSLVENE